jgi:hypothetical protein
MRFSNVILGGLSAVAAIVTMVACGGSNNGNTGGSGGTGTTSATGTTSSATGAGACAPKASCIATDKDCIGLVDNSGKAKFGLRMSELDITTPDALTKGIIKQTVQSSVTPNVPSCNLMGAATFSWLIQFDTAAGTLKTGGAKPVTDPTAGYAFDDEMVTQGTATFHVQPITVMSMPDASGNFTTPKSTDTLYIPIFLDATGTQVVLLPMHDAALDMGTLSANRNCIGKFNAAGLQPSNSCLSDDTTPEFITGGTLSGYITLEEADTVTVSALQESLCVLLSGDASTYGDGAKPTAHCKRTNNAINFQGDTCSMAGQTCKDAVTLGGKFAASSVLITN